MKIFICSSMVFAKEMIEIKQLLEEAGHEIMSTEDLEYYEENPDHKDDFDRELALALEEDVLRDAFDKIAQCDAILVLNYEKKGIAGYVGSSVLMEISVAFFLKKQIFLLFPINREQSCALELLLVLPRILNGKLEKMFAY